MSDLTSDSGILTGGYGMNTVSRYGVLGWVEDLPSLVVGRYYHGCGSFFRGDGTQVYVCSSLVCSWWQVLVGGAGCWWKGQQPQPHLLY
jgi:hypothetical protein